MAWVKRLGAAAVLAVLTYVTVYFGWLDVPDSGAEDLLYHRAEGTSPDIKIIAIDDRSISELGSYDSWDRGMYARLVETLCVSGEIKPAVIGFDVLFDGEKDKQTDHEFAEACKAHGNVVTAFSYVFQRDVTADSDGNLEVNNLFVSDIIKPYDELYSATKHGFANALMDNKDGLIRTSFLYFPPNPKPGETIEFSFNAELYKAYMSAVNEPVELPDMDRAAYSFRYSGKIGGYETISFCDVISGAVPAEAFDGCAVLVGAYAQGMMDMYYVPVDRSSQMFGVEIHANALQALVEGKYIHKLPKWFSAMIAAFLVFIAAVIGQKITVHNTMILCVSMILVRMGAGFILFNTAGYSSEVIVSPAFLALTAGYCIVLHYYKARRSKRKIENAFKKYVAPQVVNKIAKSGEYELKLGGETREIAALFVDIRGFTPLSESLEPEQVVEILNSYLKLTTSCIFKHGGTLDKFIGDATMAIFNAPFDTEDYVYSAVLTAWDIARGGDDIERECVEKFGKHVGFGVGVNCGKAVVGNIGCDFRMDYTAIGDTVNTAARLEANAPRGKVYISDAVYEQVKDRISVEEVGEIPLKGKSKGVFVYSVTGIGREENNDETTVDNSEIERTEPQS